MISQYNLNKALLDKLASIVTDPIAVQGRDFKPKVSQDYIAEKEVPTVVDTPLGNGTDRQQGFYQVTICTPIDENKFYHLGKVDSIMQQITKGYSGRIAFYDTYVSIHKVTPSGIYSDDTHLKTALTIAYTVIA